MIETAMANFATAAKALKREGFSDREIFAMLNESLGEDSNAKAPLNLPEKDLSKRITQIMCEIGISANLKGFKYVRDAIKMAIEKPECLSSVTKVMYPEIAAMYGAKSSQVERAIRHAIEKAWEKGNLEAYMTYFGNTVSSKPTNSEFIAMIADRITLES